MKLCLLVTKELEPVPKDITILNDFEEVTVVSDKGVPLATGRHMIIEASEKSIRSWLTKFDGFWKGVGSPIMQKFEVVHIDQSIKEQRDREFKYNYRKLK